MKVEDFNIVEAEWMPEEEFIFLGKDQVVATWKGGLYEFNIDELLKKAIERLKKEGGIDEI